MIADLLFAIVVGVVWLALQVDAGALIGWLPRAMVIISQANLCQDHQLLILVGGRELPRQRNETQDQILQRRGTLISLDAETSKDEWRVVCVMPYMADF